MVVAAIDAGTTGVRCMIVGKKGEVLGFGRRSWDYSTPEFFEIAKEFDPDNFWKLVCTVTLEALKQAKTSEIEAVSTTSQRHGIVILDADGKELHGAPNIDARGAMTQYVIEESVGEKYHDITGCWPPLMFAPARLAWFEEEEPEIFASIAHLLPISDWITFRLSGHYVTEPSSASSTGFFDITKQDWSDEVASVIGVEKQIFPQIRVAGEIVGEVTIKATKECGIPEGTPVVQGGTDTHCALLAAQTNVNEVTVIAGSTTPVMMVIDEMRCAPEQKFWTSCHILPKLWTLESNATLTGAYLEWVVNLLCERAENPEECKQKTLEHISDIVKDIPPGSNETYAAIGPRIMDCRKITDVPLARLYFPQPALPQITPLNSASLIHSVLENIAYSIRGNIEQLKELAEPTKIKAIGGVTRAKGWIQILANVLNQPIQTPIQPEGSLLGAAICAAIGVGWYNGFAEASEEMVSWQPETKPDDRAKDYNSYYKRWKEIWGK